MYQQATRKLLKTKIKKLLHITKTSALDQTKDAFERIGKTVIITAYGVA